MKNTRYHGLIAMIAIGVMLLVACLFSGSPKASASPQKGMPEVNKIVLDGRTLYVFYTDKQFQVMMWLDQKEQIVDSPDGGILLPPPKDSKKKVGM